MNALEFIRHPDLVNDQSLSVPQVVIIKSIYGLPLDREELRIFKELTQLEAYPEGTEWDEITCVMPRRSGKTSQICANLSIYESCGRDHKATIGQTPTVMIIASEKRRQARICFDYILSKLRASKVLKKMILNITREEIQLTNGVSIMVFPCDQARVRGHSLIMLVADEVSAWRSEGVNPDADIIDSARPGLEFEYSKLIKISTPGGMFGEIWNDHKQFFGKENSDVLVFGSGGHNTRYFNPSYSLRKLAKIKKRKPFVYETEHLAQFKKSQGMFDPLQIDNLVNHDRALELPPDVKMDYWSFVDTAGGSGKDCYALAIGHVEGGRIIIDVIRSKEPPFDPESQTEEYAQLLHSYRINRVMGDRFSGDWCARSFQRHGIYYEKCVLSKSEIYLECESPVNCNIVELPLFDTLLQQLKLLQRTPRSGMKDKVDTPSGQPEDEANVCCGAMWLINSELHNRPLEESKGILESIETEADKLKRATQNWLLGIRKKKTPRPGEIDLEELEREIDVEGLEAEMQRKDSSKDVSFHRGWGDDD